MLLALSVSAASAGVDVRRGSFSEIATDLDANGDGFKLRIQRIYDSRSSYNGMFGHGWCSELEAQVQLLPEGAANLVECGEGRRTQYSPTEANSRLPKIADEIVEALEKRANAKRVGNRADLRERLLRDSVLRQRAARAVGIRAAPLRPGSKLRAQGTPGEMAYDGFTFVVEDARGRIRKFSSAGKLQSIHDRSGHWLKLAYREGKLISISDDLGRKLNFVYDPSKGKVREIRGPNGWNVVYKYDGDLLVSADGGEGFKSAYQYDSAKNLTRVTRADNTTVAAQYDREKDRLLRIDLNGECSESYSYAPASDHLKVKATKVCGNRTTAEGSLVFGYRHQPDGPAALATLETTSKSEKTRIELGPAGRPVAAVQNGRTTKFSYLPDGRLASRTNADLAHAFAYEGRSARVSAVTTSYFHPGGKVRARKWTKYKYDVRGNVVHAKSSQGRAIDLKYDRRGRIQAFRAKGEREVSIAYDDRFGKPKTISQAQTGSLKIAYDGRGNLKSFAPKNAPAEKLLTAYYGLADLLRLSTAGTGF